MMLLWNRREVFMGFDIGQLADVRSALAVAGIKYVVRSANRNLFSTRRGAMGSFGENPAFSALYYVYVHKDDFERAQEALRPHRRD